MVVSLLQAVHRVLSVPAAVLRRESAKDAELFALRHENAVLRRQISGPVRYEPADRFWFAAWSSLTPRWRWRTVPHPLQQPCSGGITTSLPPKRTTTPASDRPDAPRPSEDQDTHHAAGQREPTQGHRARAIPTRRVRGPLLRSTTGNNPPRDAPQPEADSEPGTAQLIIARSSKNVRAERTAQGVRPTLEHATQPRPPPR